MADWVEVKPRCKLNLQKKSGKASPTIDFSINLYSGIASMNPTMGSQATTIPGIEKSKPSYYLDVRVSRVVFNRTLLHLLPFWIICHLDLTINLIELMWSIIRHCRAKWILALFPLNTYIDGDQILIF